MAPFLEAVDAVYVATPPDQHLPAIRAALAARLGVLRKPFTTSLKDTEEVIARAQDTGVAVMEAVWTLALPAYQALKRRMDKLSGSPAHRMTFDFSYPLWLRRRAFPRSGARRGAARPGGIRLCGGDLPAGTGTASGCLCRTRCQGSRSQRGDTAAPRDRGHGAAHAVLRSSGGQPARSGHGAGSGLPGSLVTGRRDAALGNPSGPRRPGPVRTPIGTRAARAGCTGSRHGPPCAGSSSACRR